MRTAPALVFLTAFPLLASSAPGDLDATFGNGGIREVEMDIELLAVSADGRITAAGRLPDGAVTVLTLEPDGSPAEGGRLVVPHADAFVRPHAARDVMRA